MASASNAANANNNGNANNNTVSNANHVAAIILRTRTLTDMPTRAYPDKEERDRVQRIRRAGPSA